MDIITLLLLSASLAMDAFAVCVSSGMVICHIRATPILKMAGSFGLFSGDYAAHRLHHRPQLRG